jgi:hypothetical protein
MKLKTCFLVFLGILSSTGVRAADFDGSIHTKVSVLGKTPEAALGLGLNAAAIFPSNFSIDVDYKLIAESVNIFTVAPGLAMRKNSMLMKLKAPIGWLSSNFAAGLGFDIDFVIGSNFTAGFGVSLLKSFKENTDALYIENVSLGWLF